MQRSRTQTHGASECEYERVTFIPFIMQDVLWEELVLCGLGVMGFDSSYDMMWTLTDVTLRFLPPPGRRDWFRPVSVSSLTSCCDSSPCAVIMHLLPAPRNTWKKLHLCPLGKPEKRRSFSIDDWEKWLSLGGSGVLTGNERVQIEVTERENEPLHI